MIPLLQKNIEGTRPDPPQARSICRVGIVDDFLTKADERFQVSNAHLTFKLV